VLEVCLDAHDLVVSEHLLNEVHRHLQGKFAHTAAMANERIALLRDVATLIHPAAVDPGTCRDPDDLAVLGTALAGDAACLVTGDKDLLTLQSIEGRPILSPRQFWEKLRAL